MENELRLSETTRIEVWNFERVLEIHSRAISCHCECLGMNAENQARFIIGDAVAYQAGAYFQVMRKWGLINEKGEPSI